jgi:hypothetical protein
MIAGLHLPSSWVMPITGDVEVMTITFLGPKNKQTIVLFCIFYSTKGSTGVSAAAFWGEKYEKGKVKNMKS